ncbi:hypothetical protein [Anatilimnocola floriformis]|uniref:hypothetical protein n=1 Tax=Anatilimnocola floriformis TaxID=2948575 RepID=UPI0020C2822C|nr:hypothetical protein [Anatilimnocola floriformis]
MIPPSNENAIWSRVIHPERGDVVPEAARYLLNLQFEQIDLDRMQDLLDRNQAASLTPAEAEELRHFRHVGMQLDLLHSKARLALQQTRS